MNKSVLQRVPFYLKYHPVNINNKITTCNKVIYRDYEKK